MLDGSRQVSVMGKDGKKVEGAEAVDSADVVGSTASETGAKVLRKL